MEIKIKFSLKKTLGCLIQKAKFLMQNKELPLQIYDQNLCKLKFLPYQSQNFSREKLKCCHNYISEDSGGSH